MTENQMRFMEAVRNPHRFSDERATQNFNGDTEIHLDPDRRYGPQDRFSSMDNAAIAFGLTYYDYFFRGTFDHERGAFIYRIEENGLVYYQFGNFFTGDPVSNTFRANVVTGMVTRNITSDSSQRVAMVHTHPPNDGAFSSPDIRLAEGDYPLFPAMIIFLATEVESVLEIKKYVPNSDMDEWGLRIR
jgi:hypothetical protein